MGEDANPNKAMIAVPKQINLISILGFSLSLGVIALGQPARLGWLGAIAAVAGFTLFFSTLPTRQTKLKRFISGAAWFGAVQLIQLSWMTSIEFQGYYVLILYSLLALGLAAQFGLLTLVVPADGKIQISKVLFCAALWTLMEWLRLFFLCGFSWNPVGLALTHFTHSLQFTSLFGVFGMSFWVMLTNLWGVNVLRSTRFNRDKTLAWAALACIPYLFGAVHLNYHLGNSLKEENKLDVALVQTSLLPSEKVPSANRMHEFIPPSDQWKRIISSLKEKQKNRWDLIVLPEAAVPLLSDLTFYPYELVKELLVAELGQDVVRQFPSMTYPHAEERVLFENKIWCVSNLFICQTLANHFQAEVVAGLDHTEKGKGKNFNSAFYFKPNSITHDHYDKQILLPLAEYLPFECLRPLTKNYGILEFFTQGSGAKVFGQKVPFSLAICYEETFPEIMREGRSKGSKLFINLTNDNYYPHSTLHEQHFSHARLRAVENGTPLVRACNSGVTAAVDSLGQILDRFDAETASAPAKEGTLSCSLPTYQYSTLYSFWGEAGIVGICLIMLFSYGRLRKS
jgi:apolipoprotein N-acyltransferase